MGGDVRGRSVASKRVKERATREDSRHRRRAADISAGITVVHD